MNTYTTIIRAIDPVDGKMKTWCGPKIQAYTWEQASQICQETGLGYCSVDGMQRDLDQLN